MGVDHRRADVIVSGEGTLLTNWTNWNTQGEISRSKKVCEASKTR